MAMNDQTAVVYGGARGIGKAYCEALLKKGYKVYFGDILEKEGTDSMHEFEASYPERKAVFKKCDVLLDSDVKALMDQAVTENKRVDLVIANAGILDEREWKKCVDINLGGMMRIFYTAMEHMSAVNGGEGGDFIATSSIVGKYPFFAAPAYSATKHGIVGFIRAWGNEENYNLTKVRCNCICPDHVDTALPKSLTAEHFSLSAIGNKILRKHRASDEPENDSAKKLRLDPMTPEFIAEAMMSVLEDNTANGKCLIVLKHKYSYATFSSISDSIVN